MVAFWATPLEHVVLYGSAGGGGTRRDAQLAVEGGRMAVDSAWTDDEMLGNLGISPTLSEQAQHLHLTCGQLERNCRGYMWSVR